VDSKPPPLTAICGQLTSL